MLRIYKQMTNDSARTDANILHCYAGMGGLRRENRPNKQNNEEKKTLSKCSFRLGITSASNQLCIESLNIDAHRATPNVPKRNNNYKLRWAACYSRMKSFEPALIYFENCFFRLCHFLLVFSSLYCCAGSRAILLLVDCHSADSNDVIAHRIEPSKQFLKST